MKIYKKDLNEFIEAVENKALKSINEKFKTLIKESKDKRFELISEDLKEIEKLLLEAHEKATKVRSVQNNWSNGYYCETRIRDSITYVRCTKSCEMIDTEEEIELSIKMDKEINETKSEYFKVKSFIKSNTPKKGYEYLKEIGFDVTSIPVYDNKSVKCTSIATVVNTEKLFVCGDNK